MSSLRFLSMAYFSFASTVLNFDSSAHELEAPFPEVVTGHSGITGREVELDGKRHQEEARIPREPPGPFEKDEVSALGQRLHLLTAQLRDPEQALLGQGVANERHLLAPMLEIGSPTDESEIVAHDVDREVGHSPGRIRDTARLDELALRDRGPLHPLLPTAFERLPDPVDGRGRSALAGGDRVRMERPGGAPGEAVEQRR